jgi:hypothetical protein
LEVIRFSPSDGCPATAPYLASTQAMRSLHVSSALKIPDCVVAHRSDRCSTPVRSVPTGQTGQTGQTHWSDRSGAVAAPSSVLRSWLCGSTKEPSGFLVNHWKPRELGVCRMNLPGPTTSVGTRTDYSMGPWDYPACAARHLMA